MCLCRRALTALATDKNDLSLSEGNGLIADIDIVGVDQDLTRLELNTGL